MCGFTTLLLVEDKNRKVKSDSNLLKTKKIKLVKEIHKIPEPVRPNFYERPQ